MRLLPKTTVLFLTLSLIPLTLIGVIAYYNSEKSLKDSSGNHFEYIAQETIKNVDRKFFEVYQNIQSWAELGVMQDVITGDLDGQIISFLIQMNKKNKYFASLDVLDASGEVIASSVTRKIGKDYREKAYYARILETKKAQIEDLHLDKNTKTWEVDIAFPIKSTYEEDKVIGIFSAHWMIDEINDIIKTPAQNKKLSAIPTFLISKDGLIISSNNAESTLKNLLEAKLKSSPQLFSQKKDGYLVEELGKNNEYLTGYSYSKGSQDYLSLGWGIFIMQESATAFYPIKRLRSIIIGIGLFVVLGVVMLSLIISRSIALPVLSLAKRAEEVARGDWELKTSHASNDELGSLAKSFDQMIVDLKKTTVSRDSLIKEIGERKKAEKQLFYLAHHDALTSLPNRSLLLDRLQQLIHRSQRDSEYNFALIFIDLDRFKLINDSFGHLKGDELLIQVSHRLKQCVRSVDTVARLGGDEFVILQDKVRSVNDVSILVERIQQDFKSPFELFGQKVYLEASMGVALHKPEYINPTDILRDADNAMYRAKSLGNGHYQIFDETMHTHAMTTLQLETDLHHAVIQKKEFFIHYQPIISLKTNKIVRLEALLRWQHPQRGLVSPLEFIPLAEETGLIVPIGYWVIKEVCRQHREWSDKGLANVPVAVNFATKQFEEKGLIKIIKEILSETKTPAKDIGIEITESVAMRDINQNILIIRELHNLGIQISIDDFGTGYSSFNSLRLFPIDSLKIDRNFICNIADNANDASITNAIVMMAHSLGFKTTAEGVEKQSQLEILKENGCDEAQGFLISRPLPAEEIARMLS